MHFWRNKNIGLEYISQHSILLVSWFLLTPSYIQEALGRETFGEDPTLSTTAQRQGKEGAVRKVRLGWFPDFSAKNREGI